MVDITANTRFRRVELPGSRIDCEMVFFDQNAGKYYATGPVGADIWDFIDSERFFSEICEHLLELYQVDRPSCEAQSKAFLSQLQEAGLVVATPST